MAAAGPEATLETVRIDGDWLVVDPEAPPGEGCEADRPIYHQLPRHHTVPRAVVRTPLELPPGSALAAERFLIIAQTVLGPTGRIERVRVVMAPKEFKDLESNLVDLVREWRFEPATIEGRPVAVYYNLSIKHDAQGMDETPLESRAPDQNL